MKYAFAIAVLFLAGCRYELANTNSSIKNSNENNNKDQTCVLQQTITDTTAILNWSNLKIIQAVNVDEYSQLESVAQFFWYNPDTNEVYVDANFFSDLMPIDATNVSEESTTIGFVLPDIFQQIEPQALVMLLIETHVIRTYVHLDADVCLTNDEFTKGGDYIAHFTAIHRYCTNDCYEDEYTFTVKIKKNGNIVVTL